MQESAEIVADHYQKTYELTLQMWEQRNTTLLQLLAVVGVAALVTFNVPQAQPLLVDLIAKLVGMSDEGARQDLRRSFPYGLIQSILLMVILYLTAVLYHRTAFIRRCYAYLAAMEPELRAGLELPPDSVAFTRESVFYGQHRATFGRLVSGTYVGMLGLLLLAFLCARILADFSDGNFLIGTVDVALAIPIVLLFVAYVRLS
ncbi:hypothetical protein P3T23_002483 [Paraburkholderia sp. GAS448]|uniref:hypothetical protein n=1 Tax=Paraburkholderia sp. GAS448 TaxID=3035136 RepID=UPI003D19418F